MTRARHSVTWALAACLALASGSLAARDVIERIPDNALALAVINRLGTLDARVQQVGRTMQLPLPGPLAALQARTTIGKALDPQGTLAVAVVPGGDASSPPAAVWYLPVTDYQKLLEQVTVEDDAKRIARVRVAGRPWLVARKGGYAVAARPGNQEALRKALRAKKSIAGSVGPFQSYLQEQDVAGLVTASGVQLLVQLGQQGLAQARQTIQRMGQENVGAAAAIDLYAEMLRGLGQEIETCAVGLRIERTGLVRVTSRTIFRPSGVLAPLMAKAEPYEGDLLAGLPDTPFVAAFAGVVPTEAYGPMLRWSANLMKAVPQIYGLEPEQVDQMIQLSEKTLTGLRAMSFLMGVGRPGAPLYSEMMGVLHVDDADAYLTRYREYWQELDKLLGDAHDSFLANLELEATQVGDTPGWKLTMQMPATLGQGVPDPEEFQRVMEKMFGPGGKMTMYLVRADKHRVLMGYTDTELMEKAMRLIRQGGGGLSGSKGVARTARLLPEGAQAVGFFSTGGAIAFANRLAGLMGGPAASKKLPSFPEAPPVGWAAKASSNGLETELVVPPELLRAIGQFVVRVRQLEVQGAAVPE